MTNEEYKKAIEESRASIERLGRFFAKMEALHHKWAPEIQKLKEVKNVD